MIEPGDIVRCVRGGLSAGDWGPAKGKLYLVTKYHSSGTRGKYLHIKELTPSNPNFDGGGWEVDRFEKI